MAQIIASLPNLAAMKCYHRRNRSEISLLEIICLKKITFLLTEVKSVGEHLPSILSIRKTKKNERRKERNFKSYYA